MDVIAFNGQFQADDIILPGPVIHQTEKGGSDALVPVDQAHTNDNISSMSDTVQSSNSRSLAIT